MPETIDTAALDAWLDKALFGWTFRPDPPGGARSAHFQKGGAWRDYRPKYSTTGDGRELVERALIDRGYWITVVIGPRGADVSIAKAITVCGRVEHESTNMAVAQAARAAIEAEV